MAFAQQAGPEAFFGYVRKKRFWLWQLMSSTLMARVEKDVNLISKRADDKPVAV